MRIALKAWAIANGRAWKKKLNDARMNGTLTNGELQGFMNIAGPTHLLKIPTRLFELIRKPMPTTLDSLRDKQVVLSGPDGNVIATGELEWSPALQQWGVYGNGGIYVFSTDEASTVGNNVRLVRTPTLRKEGA